MYGVHLVVEEGVFPPDKGTASKLLARSTLNFCPKRCLDMGCGTGILAILLARNGATLVHAVDIHLPAVMCTTKNVEANGLSDRIAVIQSDLFDNSILSRGYDLLVFNHPLYPGSGRRLFGPGEEGGKKIIRRFLNEAKNHLNIGGGILMPFSTFVAQEHDPATIACQLGFTCEKLGEETDGLGQHRVYLFKMKDEASC